MVRELYKQALKTDYKRRYHSTPTEYTAVVGEYTIIWHDHRFKPECAAVTVLKAGNFVAYATVDKHDNTYQTDTD